MNAESIKFLVKFKFVRFEKKIVLLDDLLEYGFENKISFSKSVIIFWDFNELKLNLCY